MCSSNESSYAFFQDHPKLPKGDNECVVVEAVDSKEMDSYSSFGWAIERDTSNYWSTSSGYYWPSNSPRVNSLKVLIDIFQEIGYIKMDILPENYNEYVDGYERVAIYVNEDNIPMHASRQLIGGIWTSKLPKYRIEHRTLAFLEGDHFGCVTEVMHRERVCEESTTPDTWNRIIIN
jgi:hypothetical protein